MIAGDIDLVDVRPLIEAAGRESAGRQDFAERANLKNQFDMRGMRFTERDVHFWGRLCESAAAIAFNLPAPATIGSITAIDLGNIAQVRGRVIQPGKPLPDLSIDRRDLLKPHLPLLLVRLDLEELIAQMVGWLLIGEAHERAEQLEREGTQTWFAPMKCWFVPGPYHSTKSLRDWIWMGARPFQWPIVPLKAS
jgi:hypothetical protein